MWIDQDKTSSYTKYPLPKRNTVASGASILSKKETSVRRRASKNLTSYGKDVYLIWKEMKF